MKTKDKERKLELVEFYPKGRHNGKYLGTAHFYHKEYGMDLRDIRIMKTKKTVLVHFPYQKAIDLETTEEVSFPIISFTDPEVMRSIISECRELMSEFFKTYKFTKEIMALTDKALAKRKELDRARRKEWLRKKEATKQCGNPQKKPQ